MSKNSKYQILSECQDYDILLNNLNERILYYFEEQLNLYTNGLMTCDEEYGYPTVVLWYNGLIKTDTLVKTYINVEF